MVREHQVKLLLEVKPFRLHFDAQKLRVDMARHGMESKDLALIAGVSVKQIYRFLHNEVQTTKMARKLAGALGYSIRRYLLKVGDHP